METDTKSSALSFCIMHHQFIHTFGYVLGCIIHPIVLLQDHTQWVSYPHICRQSSRQRVSLGASNDGSSYPNVRTFWERCLKHLKTLLRLRRHQSRFITVPLLHTLTASSLLKFPARSGPSRCCQPPKTPFSLWIAFQSCGSFIQINPQCLWHLCYL